MPAKSVLIKYLAVIALVCFPATAYSAYIQFSVSASGNSSSGGTGLDTGLSFTAGDSITGFADVNDLWSAGVLPRWSNADGLVKDLYATGTDESGQPAGTTIGQNYGTWTQYGLSAPYGSLIGSIDGTFFFLGTNFDLTAPETGTLFLHYWDSDRWDNSESVTVSISAVPVPSAIWLFGSGLVGFWGFIHKKRKGFSRKA